MQSLVRKERLSMNGFFVNIKIDGVYQTFSLVDITEDGIGVLIPNTIQLNNGEQFDVRYDIIDENYEGFNSKVNVQIRKHGVAGTGVVRRIEIENSKTNLVGFKMDYIDKAEHKEAQDKVKKARAYIKKLMDMPKVHLEFRLQVEEPGCDAKLRNFPKFDGVLSTEDQKIRFLVDAELEHIFINEYYVTVKLPFMVNGKEFVCQGYLEDNIIFNMYKNLITIRLDLWDKDDAKIVKKNMEKHLREREDILQFSDPVI